MTDDSAPDDRPPDRPRRARRRARRAARRRAARRRHPRAGWSRNALDAARRAEAPPAIAPARAGAGRSAAAAAAVRSSRLVDARSRCSARRAPRPADGRPRAGVDAGDRARPPDRPQPGGAVDRPRPRRPEPGPTAGATAAPPGDLGRPRRRRRPGDPARPRRRRAPAPPDSNQPSARAAPGHSPAGPVGDVARRAIAVAAGAARRRGPAVGAARSPSARDVARRAGHRGRRRHPTGRTVAVVIVDAELRGPLARRSPVARSGRGPGPGAPASGPATLAAPGRAGDQATCGGRERLDDPSRRHRRAGRRHGPRPTVVPAQTASQGRRVRAAHRVLRRSPRSCSSSIALFRGAGHRHRPRSGRA